MNTITLHLRWYKRITKSAAELAVFNPSVPMIAGKVKVEGTADVSAERCIEDAATAYRQVMAEEGVYYCSLRFDGGWKYEP